MFYFKPAAFSAVDVCMLHQVTLARLKGLFSLVRSAGRSSAGVTEIDQGGFVREAPAQDPRSCLAPDVVDSISHWFARLVCCSDSILASDFVKGESLLLRHRLIYNCVSPQSRAEVLDAFPGLDCEVRLCVFGSLRLWVFASLRLWVFASLRPCVLASLVL